jgi:hypothetical protein
MRTTTTRWSVLFLMALVSSAIADAGVSAGISLEFNSSSDLDNLVLTGAHGKFNHSGSVLKIEATDKFAHARWPGEFGDGTIVANFTFKAGTKSKNTVYGVAFRGTGSPYSGSFYLFGCSGDGYWGIWKRVKGSWKTIKKPNTKGKIYKYVSNDLKVDCRGRTMTFTLNTREIATINDDMSGKGWVSCYVDKGITAQFGHLRIKGRAGSSVPTRAYEKPGVEMSSSPATILNLNFSKRSDVGKLLLTKDRADFLISEEGVLGITANSSKAAHARYITKFRNGAVEVRTRFVNGPEVETTISGITFRGNGDPADGTGGSMYLFGISGKGNYSIWKRVNGSWQYWKRSGTTSGLKKKKWNTIKVEARGTTFKFYVNGVYAETLEEDNLKSGWVGLYVDGKVTGVFDDFKVVDY